MSSERRIESSRANGKKSHGPVTPEGKQRASSNSLKHGLTAETLVLSNEKRDEFDRILLGNEAEFTPETETETHLVRELSAAQWRQYRCWAIETTKFDTQMDIMEDDLAKKFKKIDEPSRIAFAFDALTEKPGFNLLMRYENNCRRAYHKALSALQAIRRERSKQQLPAEQPVTSNPPEPEPTAEPATTQMRNEPNPSFEHPETDPSTPINGKNERPPDDPDTQNPTKL